MATHSSTLAWKIPRMEEPGRLQSMGSLRVGHGWATSLSLFIFMHWRRKWQPTPVFLPGESQGWGSLVGCIYGVAQSRTRLKWLSSIVHSSNSRDLLLRKKCIRKVNIIINYFECHKKKKLAVIWEHNKIAWKLENASDKSNLQQKLGYNLGWLGCGWGF